MMLRKRKLAAQRTTARTQRPSERDTEAADFGYARGRHDVPLHPTNALALSMLAHAVGSDLTAAHARQKHHRARLSKTATHVTGDTRALPVANLRTSDVAKLLKVTEGLP